MSEKEGREEMKLYSGLENSSEAPICLYKHKDYFLQARSLPNLSASGAFSTSDVGTSQQ